MRATDCTVHKNHNYSRGKIISLKQPHTEYIFVMGDGAKVQQFYKCGAKSEIASNFKTGN